MDSKCNSPTQMQSIRKKFRSISQSLEQMKSNNQTKTDDYIIIIDGFKDIVDRLGNTQGNEHKSSLKAQAYSRIGYIYYHLLQNIAKAKTYYDHCISIGAESAWYESWYVEAIECSKKIKANIQHNRSKWEMFDDVHNDTIPQTKSHHSANYNQTKSSQDQHKLSITKNLLAADKEFDKLNNDSSYHDDHILILIDSYKQVLQMLMHNNDNNDTITAKINGRIGLLFYKFLKLSSKAKIYLIQCRQIVHQASCNGDNGCKDQDWYREVDIILNSIMQQQNSNNDNKDQSSSNQEKSEAENIHSNNSTSHQSNCDPLENDKQYVGYSSFMDNITRETNDIFTNKHLFSTGNIKDNQVKVALQSANKDYQRIIKTASIVNNTAALKLVNTYQEIIDQLPASQSDIIAELQFKVGNIYYKIIRDLVKAKEYYAKSIQLMDMYDNSESDWLIIARQSLNQINKLKATGHNVNANANANANQHPGYMHNNFDANNNNNYYSQSSKSNNNQSDQMFNSYFTSQKVFVSKLKFDVAVEKLKHLLDSNDDNSNLSLQLKKTFQQIIYDTVFNEENLRAKAYYQVALINYYLEKDANQAKLNLEACLKVVGNTCPSDGWYQDANQFLQAIIGGHSDSNTPPKQSTSEYSDIDPSSFFYDDHIKLQIAKRKFDAYDQKLHSLQALDDSCDRDFEALILIDSYKEIICLLNQSHRDLIAKANCRIGRIYYYIVKNNDKAVLYCQRCIDITSIDSRLERWCRQAYNIVKEISVQMEQNCCNKEAEDSCAIEAELIKEEQNLRKATGNIGMFLQLIYRRYPPRQDKVSHYQLPDVITVSQERKLLNKALVHYHPDRNSKREYGLKWYRQCEMITKLINDCKKNIVSRWTTFE